MLINTDQYCEMFGLDKAQYLEGASYGLHILNERTSKNMHMKFAIYSYGRIRLLTMPGRSIDLKIGMVCQVFVDMLDGGIVCY